MTLEKLCGRCHLTSLWTLGVTYLVRGVCFSSPRSGRDCQRHNAAEGGSSRENGSAQCMACAAAFRPFLRTRYCLLRCDYVARQLASGRMITVRAPCSDSWAELSSRLLPPLRYVRALAISAARRRAGVNSPYLVTWRVDKEVKWHRPYDFSNVELWGVPRFWNVFT